MTVEKPGAYHFKGPNVNVTSSETGDIMFLLKGAHIPESV